MCKTRHEKLVVGLVISISTRIASRVNPRSSEKSVHFQTTIVRKRWQSRHPTDSLRLEPSVLLKGRPCLFHLKVIRYQRRHTDKLNARLVEQAIEFPNLAGVSTGQHNTLNRRRRHPSAPDFFMGIFIVNIEPWGSRHL